MILIRNAHTKPVATPITPHMRAIDGINPSTVGGEAYLTMIDGKIAYRKA